MSGFVTSILSKINPAAGAVTGAIGAKARSNLPQQTAASQSAGGAGGLGNLMEIGKNFMGKVR